MERSAADSRAEIIRDVGLGADAGGMSEARAARSGHANVVDDRILHVWTDAGRHVVERERVPHAPGHVVIGAGRVAAHPERADDTVLVVEREAAAEHDDAAGRL